MEDNKIKDILNTDIDKIVETGKRKNRIRKILILVAFIFLLLVAGYIAIEQKNERKAAQEAAEVSAKEAEINKIVDNPYFPNAVSASLDGYGCDISYDSDMHVITIKYKEKSNTKVSRKDLTQLKENYDYELWAHTVNGINRVIRYSKYYYDSFKGIVDVNIEAYSLDGTLLFSVSNGELKNTRFDIDATTAFAQKAFYDDIVSMYKAGRYGAVVSKYNNVKKWGILDVNYKDLQNYYSNAMARR